jgi:hypothetical protein
LSIYPTMSILLLLTGIVCAAAVATARDCRTWAFMFIGVATGIALAFAYALRTSYGLVAACQLIGTMLAAAIWQRPAVQRFARLLAAVGVGAVLFHAGAICTLGPNVRGVNDTAHGLWHPIVLGLSFPHASDLSKREGIGWDDSIGLDLAKRVDPSVTYLGPIYEQTLRAYYFGLWKKYPREMLAIYSSKAREFGRMILLDLHAALGWPTLDQLPKYAILNIQAWLSVIAVFAVLALLAFPSSGHLAAFGMSAAVGAACVAIEQTICGPFLAMAYQGALLVETAALLSAVASLGCLQLLHRSSR